MKSMLVQGLLLATLASGVSPGAESSDTNRPAWRDPFWPVGYRPAVEEETPPAEKPAVVPEKPKPPEPPAPVADWEAARKLLNVSAFGEKNAVRFCLVNGKLVQEGDFVSVIHRSMEYTWQVKRIDRNSENMLYEPVLFDKPGAFSQK